MRKTTEEHLQDKLRQAQKELAYWQTEVEVTPIMDIVVQNCVHYRRVIRGLQQKIQKLKRKKKCAE